MYERNLIFLVNSVTRSTRDEKSDRRLEKDRKIFLELSRESLAREITGA